MAGNGASRPNEKPKRVSRIGLARPRNATTLEDFHLGENGEKIKVVGFDRLIGGSGRSRVKVISVTTPRTGEETFAKRTANRWHNP